jgi:LCP family protein required for cell wall assembly
MSRYGDRGNAAGAAPRQDRQRERRRGQRGSLAWRAAGWLSAFLVLLLVAISVAAYAKYRAVWGSIRRIDVTGLGNRPPRYNDALNVLLIGSDSRAGQNRKFGAGIQGQRSDTVMLLHISPGHRGVTVMSLPRDTMVPYLGCPSDGAAAPGQQADPGHRERLNQTFANGGPGCLWKTVEAQAGIHIDHFIELTFTGFEHVINDIGGVNICLPVAVDDPDSGLSLQSGEHHVMGAQALAFWRERHIGLGSDLQRIQRDQYLMASIVRGVARSEFLGDPGRLYAVVTDTARAMTTDAGMDLTTMLTIAESLRGLSSKAVQFVTVPDVPYPRDRQAEIEFAQPQAAALFSAIAHDQALPRATRAVRAGAVRPVRRPVDDVHRHVPAAHSSAPAPVPVNGLARTYGGINATAPACGDQAAFAGGDVPADFPNP